VTGGKLITIHMRDIDIQNTTKLYEIDGIKVLKHPYDFKTILS
jgi:dihydromethanopterin reductase (acceptor)